VQHTYESHALANRSVIKIEPPWRRAGRDSETTALQPAQGRKSYGSPSPRTTWYLFGRIPAEQARCRLRQRQTRLKVDAYTSTSSSGPVPVLLPQPRLRIMTKSWSEKTARKRAGLTRKEETSPRDTNGTGPYLIRLGPDKQIERESGRLRGPAKIGCVAGFARNKDPKAKKQNPALSPLLTGKGFFTTAAR